MTQLIATDLLGRLRSVLEAMGNPMTDGFAIGAG